jgi:exosortase
MSKGLVCALVAAIASFLLLYRDVIYWLADDWGLDGNYSHGWLIVPAALYLAWERRERLRRATPSTSVAGLAALILFLALLAAGTVAAETFSTRVSIVGVVVATIWFVLGKEHVRILWFPLAFLLLMIPIPMIIFNRIAFPLQLLASEFGQRTLALFGVPVFREGNLIVLEHMSLDVAEACSGIRSLVSLFTLSILYSYFSTTSRTIRIALIGATVPIAIAANGVRVASTGLAVHMFGNSAAEGLFHESSGEVIFVVAGVALIAMKHVAEFIGQRRGATLASGARV